MFVKIVVTPCGARCNGNIVNQKGWKTFDSMVKNLEETEGALNTMWEGEAKKGFHTAFTNDMIQLRNFYNAIIAYINALRLAIQKYIEAENKNVELAATRKYGG